LPPKHDQPVLADAQNQDAPPQYRGPTRTIAISAITTFADSNTLYAALAPMKKAMKARTTNDHRTEKRVSYLLNSSAQLNSAPERA
jgi:hypothetical protein